jgi:hypothetical protein
LNSCGSGFLFKFEILGDVPADDTLLGDNVDLGCIILSGPKRFSNDGGWSAKISLVANEGVKKSSRFVGSWNSLLPESIVS